LALAEAGSPKVGPSLPFINSPDLMRAVAHHLRFVQIIFALDEFLSLPISTTRNCAAGR
jgi:hypothetical protein